MAQISTNQLSQLCHRVAVSLEAGLDVRRVWETEAKRGSSAERLHAGEIARRLSSGEGLADSMREAHGFYPPLACEMVRVGEETGRLEAVFHKLSEHYKHLIELRRTFLMGVALPLTELAAAVGIIGLFIMLTWMLDIDPFGVGIKGAPLLVLYVMFIMMAVTAVAVPIVAVQRGWLGPLPVLVAMKIPVLGGCVQTLALSRMAWSLGMAIDAGMDARRSVRLALRSTQNPYYMSHEESADLAIESGREINEALRGAGEYPAEFLNVLETGEMTGEITESMARLSEEYRRRAEVTLKLLAVVGGVMILLCVLLMIGGMIILMFQRYLSATYGQFQDL